MYNGATMRSDACTASKTASSTVLSLPIHAWLTDIEIKDIIEIIKDAI
jgi:dTDP-4-amino-4,6-dideoxygalactose transaminase